MTKYALMVALSCLALPSILLAQPPARSGYDIAWFDEFDGTSLDTTRWTASLDASGGGNFSLEHYLPQMVTVSGGKLIITSDDVHSGTKPYRSGKIETTNYQLYGRWDVRAKLPGTKGTWPAHWLLSNNAVFPWPSRGEIDILENRGNEPLQTISAFHYGTNPPYAPQFKSTSQSTARNGNKVNYHDGGFHTYSLEWDPEQIRFYVDDVHHYTVYDSDVNGFLTGTFNAPGGPIGVGPMRLIINTAIGGTFLDNPDGTSVWPQTHEVDYVHAYTKSASPPVLTFENGDFEEQGGSLAYWSKFGDAGFNVSTDNGQTGSEMLKLYGQFNGGNNFSGVEQGISVNPGDEIRASVDAFIAANDSLVGTTNQLLFKIEYYNKLYGRFNTNEYISSDLIILADAGSPTNQTFNDEILSTAPAGAVEARVGLVFKQSANAGGSVYLDNVQFEDTSVGEEPSLASFSSDFDSLIPVVTIGDGWLYYHTNGPSSPYGGPAPNGPQICSLINNAGNQYLNMFVDYDNPLMPTTVLTNNVFQEQTFTAEDAALGETWTFEFDYARAVDPWGPGGSTTTGAFIRVFDGAFNLLEEELLDTTGATGPAFSPGSVSLTFNPAWINGGKVQFGFTSTVTNYEPSGVYYDNVNFSPAVSPPVVLGDANGDGILDFIDVSAFLQALFDPGAYAAAYPGVDPVVVLDMNNDEVFDFVDVSGFLAALGF